MQMSVTKKNIVWLASYPKSGNTWFRVFLSNLFSDSPQAVHINNLNLTSISSNRGLIDSYLGIHSAELDAEEVDNLRPQVYQKLSQESEGETYIKTHEAWTKNSKGIPIFPEEITLGVIYIIRNPLDVAISYSFHNNESIDSTISVLNDEVSALCERKDRISIQTRQKLNSWSGHVSSWIEESKLPVHVIRYEDMLHDPGNAFKGAIDFLKLEYGEPEIVSAIINSSFDTLRMMEDNDGFKERAINSRVFFREGKSNQWESVLSEAQINEVISHHRSIMKKFGYLHVVNEAHENEAQD